MARRKQLKLSTPAEVRKALARIANMVINGELDVKIANTITFICNAILGGIRIDEQERKIAEIERILAERD